MRKKVLLLWAGLETTMLPKLLLLPRTFMGLQGVYHLLWVLSIQETLHCVDYGYCRDQTNPDSQ